MTDQEFLNLAKERYGSRGLTQAKKILDGLYANPPRNLPEAEWPDYRSLMMDVWLDSKEDAKKRFTPKKYRKAEEAQ